MKIIHITTHYYPVNGGQQIYIKNMMSELDKYEHIVIQIDNDYDKYPTNVYSIKIPNVLSYKAIKFYAFNYLLKNKIKELINENIIDVERDIFLCHYGFHYSVVRDYKNVVVLSHGVEWDGPGNFAKKMYHKHREIINRKVLKNPNIVLISNDINFYKRLGLNEVSNKDYFKEVSPNKWLLPNSIDTLKYRKLNDYNKLFPENTIIIPRNIVPQRGMDVVIRNFERLIKNPSFNDYNLYIVGEKYDVGYYQFLVKLVKELNLEKKVVFYGSVDNDLTPLVYNSAKFTVIFSLFREGTSLAALESMACGTPVITSDIGGLRELPSIKATKDDLAEIIIKANENYYDIAEMQHDFVKDNHNITRWATLWDDILIKLMNDN